ncbi:MAG: tripartite tricarboxylate transporter substrate binding protein [Burkholderiales bacterium]|nr:tripartite tricarboxylate transporter substrate binding protein [Burkholderiales bacterium]
MIRLCLQRLLLAVIASTAAGAAHAQAYPSRPIRVLVGYGPGGSTDVTARIVAEAAAKLLGQSMIIDNRPGAAGGIALETVSRAAPDGYTIVVAPDSSLYQPVLNPALPFRVEKHFTPITLLTNQPIVIAVHPAPGWKSLRELIAAAKSRPGQIAYALPGPTSSQAVAAGILFRTAGVKLQSVPYKGGGQAVVDLVSGQVPVGVLGSAPVMPQVASGRVRLLAVTSKERAKTLPEVPSLAEAGYPGIDITQWFGALAPAGMPAEIGARLAAVFVKVLADPAVVQRLANAGLEPLGGTTETFARRIRDEVGTWSRAAKDLGLTAQ